MRLAGSLVVTLLLAGLAAGCADSNPDTSAPAPDPAPVAPGPSDPSGEVPTVTLTEPAGGPDRSAR
ncbi:hypothetical protein [Saccharomonospora iraqiensis]|uniref:hypothetical protein n=1 Tax=Saccharomonospora iraqiensis TaxID=52698 RepID=UPI0003F73D15|nr:hypothetical protein [Saccharomonospora iraqiensis]